MSKVDRSTPEGAYAAAMREVDRVKRYGDHILKLRDGGYEALDRIPENIVDIENLEELKLTGTAISDLSPLLDCRQLKLLYIEKTQVSDLRILLKLPRLFDPDRGSILFEQTPAANSSPELRRIAGGSLDRREMLEQLYDYLLRLPPYPEPLPWEVPEESNTAPELAADVPAVSPAPLRETEAGGRLPAPAPFKKLTLAQADEILKTGYPMLHDRCQAVVADLDDALAIQAVRIPNDEKLHAEHMQVTQSLVLAKAAIIGIYEALPEGFTDQEITKEDAGRLKEAFNAAIEKLQNAAQYIDRPDHTPTYGGIMKLGCSTGVAGIMSVIPGVAMAPAIGVVYAALYGADAAKAVKGLVAKAPE